MTSQVDRSHALLETRLDMHVPEFAQKRDAFLAQLANLLGIASSEIEVVSVKEGCTYVEIKLSPEAAKALSDDYRGDLTGDRSTELRELLRAFGVAWIRPDDEVQAAMISTAFVDRPDGPTFTWLHLSDLHMRGTEGAAKFKQEVFLESLLNDLPGLLDKQKLKPDAVVFTGDLAQSGTATEYDLVRGFLEKLVAPLEIKPAIYVVPGNHDVQWPEVDLGTEKEIRASIHTEEDVDRLMLEPANRKKFFEIQKRLSNFNDFISSIRDLGQPPLGHDYFYTAKEQKNGISIGIAGLNSAWRCTRKDNLSNVDVDIDLGHLLLGEPQLRGALKEVENADVRIALVHHPPMTAWYSQADYEVQKAYLPQFDFLLRGHEHMEQPTMISHLHTANEGLHIAAGALYEGGKAPLSLGLGRLEFGSGTCSLYFVNFNYKHRKWLYDSNPFWPLGMIRLALPLRIRQRLSLNVNKQYQPVPIPIGAAPHESKPVDIDVR